MEKKSALHRVFRYFIMKLKLLIICRFLGGKIIMRKRFRNLKLQQKILLSNTLLFVIPCLFLCMGLIYFVQKESNQQLNESRLVILRQIDEKRENSFDEIISYANYFTCSMWKRYEDLGTTPIRESLKEQFIEADPEVNEVIFESINCGCGTGSPKVPYANSVYNIINEAMEKVMYDADTPENAMNTAAEKIQEEIDNQ